MTGQPPADSPRSRPETSADSSQTPPPRPARAPFEDEFVGHQIGQYRIRRKLGQGAMGMVYLARDETLHRDVALKILPENLARDDDFVKRFYQEARTAARLNHTNIVSVFSVGSHEKFHYIAMEHVRGDTLDAHIKWKGKLDVREALEISRQVADALQAAHEMQILHRDIKPANIMLDRQGRAKVMDFGIAKVMNDQTSLTLTGAMIGTPKYMSPEQCQAMTIDGRSDIFSLGIVMYEMLTGKAPFDDESQLGVMMKVIDLEPARLTELEQRLPREAARIVHKSLRKKPDERYLRARDLVEDINRFLAEHEQGRSRTASPLSRLADRVSDALGAIPRAIAALGLAVVLLVLALGVTLLRKGGESASDSDVASGATGSGSAAHAGTADPVPAGPAPADPGDAPPEVRLPAVHLTGAPAEGETLTRPELRVTWSVSGPADFFLVGLNTEDPVERTDAPSAILNFSRPGEQVLRIVPVTRDGVRGETVRRRFYYQPNRRPKLVGVASDEVIPFGEGLDVNFLVTDPDGDPAHVELRIDGGEWTRFEGTSHNLPRLPVGRHAIEARAVDDKGEPSELWNHWVTVELAKDPVTLAADLFSGTGGKVDEAEAKRIMLAESGRGDALARMWVAWFQFWGRCGFTRDIDLARRGAASAFEQASTLAGGGDVRAAFLLGAAYDRGIGTEENFDLAARWISRAAEADFAPAMGYLGFMLIEGRAVRRDYQEGIRWLRQGAEAGDVNSMYNLANMYAEGIGLERDEAEAARWYGRGAERGSPRNMVRLAGLIESGRGVERDFDGAVELYREAARLGDADARSALRRLNLE